MHPYICVYILICLFQSNSSQRICTISVSHPYPAIQLQPTGYNAAVSCCFAASKWKKVFELLDAMVAAGMDGISVQ